MDRDKAFFKEVAQFRGEAKGFEFPMPIFYYDASAFFVVYTASYSKVKDLLPSLRLKPYHVSLKRTVVGLAAFSYRDSDIGPYNEFAVAVPVTMNRPVTGGGISLISALFGPTVFITHLPVTTEIALVAGKEVYNFPKFLARIDFEQGRDETAVHLSEEGRAILTLTVPTTKGRRRMHLRINTLSIFNDRLLRSEVIGQGQQLGIVLGSKGTKLTLGSDHPMARDLRDLDLGRPLAVLSIPLAQAILTNPLEAQVRVKSALR